MTKKMRICNPDYKLAEKKAMEFLKLSRSTKLPVKLMQYKNIFDDLEIKKFSWYAKKMGLTIDETCEDLETEDGLITFNPINNKYRILYNDTIENEGRKRWTLAHELGHYALNHLERMDVNILRRSDTISDNESSFEKEANCFARNILAPPQVIFHFEEKDPSIIESICNVSSEAAYNIYLFLSRGVRDYNIGYSKESVEKLGFNDFLYTINNRHFCNNCRIYFTIKKPSYCPCCGEKSLKKSLHTFGDEFILKYLGIEVDYKGRAKVCPNCQNEELDYDGKYCDVCSSYLINECADIYVHDSFDESRDLVQQSCGTTLSGNARYCHKCGNKSTFLINNHLKEWDYNPNKVFEIPF